VVIAGCAGPAFQLWPKFTGAIVDPVEGAGTVAILRIGIAGDRPTAISSLRSLATATIRPAPAVDRHAVDSRKTGHPRSAAIESLRWSQSGSTRKLVTSIWPYRFLLALRPSIDG
jgi:hypothetical protein